MALERLRVCVWSMNNVAVSYGQAPPSLLLATDQAVKKHVEYYSLNKSPFDEEGLQPLMPPSLRQETIMHIYKVCKSPALVTPGKRETSRK